MKQLKVQGNQGKSGMKQRKTEKLNQRKPWQLCERKDGKLKQWITWFEIGREKER